jgi:hypothetical protein
MYGEVLVYIILKMLLLLIFIFCGYGISMQKKEHFWNYSIVAVIAYSLIQGLRYGRGIDYEGYEYTYIHQEGSDFLFRLINQTCYMLGFPFWGVTIVYSFIMIVSIIVFLKNYRKVAIYALPIFLIVTMNPSENLIRQFLAIPFLLLAILCLMKDKPLKCSLFLFFTALIHLSSIIVVPFLLLFYYVKIPIKSPVYLVLFYFIIFFLWRIEYWDNFIEHIKFLNFFSADTQFNDYMLNANQWFGSEGSLSYRELAKVPSFTSQIVRLVKNSLLIYFGFKLLGAIRNFRVPFYLFYVSIIIMTMASDIEIIYRIGKWLDITEFFVAGMALVHIKHIKQERIFTKISFFLLIAIYVVNYMLPLIGAPAIGVKNCLFIWDI